ncbi:MAG: ABC transporter permease [Planctomycetaceae bacterium]
MVQETPKSLPRRNVRSLLFSSTVGPFLGLILVFGLFAGADLVKSRSGGRPPSFATKVTCQKLARDTSLTAVAGLGMLLIVISGGIDLSVGTGLALCATVTAFLFREEFGTVAAISAGIAAGCMIGLINGLLITLLRLVPFIVTLGMMTVLLGAGLVISEDKRIDAAKLAPKWIYELQQMTPEPRWLLVSTGVWVTLLLAAVVAALLKFSVFGRRIFAVGSNESTARLCGISVGKTRVAIYTLAGFFTGVAGLFYFSMSGGDVNPNEGMGKELGIIAAVVIGGGSLNGGRGSLLGMLAGAAIIETITHGCTTLDIGNKYRHILVGLIIIGAVALDQIRQRRTTA